MTNSDYQPTYPEYGPPAGPPPYPGAYPATPNWAGPGYPYPGPGALPQPVQGLSQALRILLAVTVVVDVLQIWRVGEQRRLLQAMQDDPGSVTLDQANAADHGVAALLIVSLGVLLATGVVWIVWLWRMRGNADSWGSDLQRRTKGWVIGGWFCPVVNLWFPYMIMRDVWDESERVPTDSYYRRPRRPLLLAWWLVWIFSTVSFYYYRGRPDTLDYLIRRTDVEIGSTVLDIVAAGLAILVVRQLTSAQTARLAPTSWAG